MIVRLTAVVWALAALSTCQESSSSISGALAPGAKAVGATQAATVAVATSTSERPATQRSEVTAAVVPNEVSTEARPTTPTAATTVAAAKEAEARQPTPAEHRKKLATSTAPAADEPSTEAAVKDDLDALPPTLPEVSSEPTKLLPFLDH
jgi:hypothetical protein